jgi:hypothetical protein
LAAIDRAIDDTNERKKVKDGGKIEEGREKEKRDDDRPAT